MHRVFWEGFGVVAAIVVSVSVLAGLAMACFSAYKIKAKSFKIGISIFRMLTVTFEVESSHEEPARRAPVRSKASRLGQ